MLQHMKRPDSDDLALTVLRLQQTLITALVGDLPIKKRKFLRERLITAIGDIPELENLSSVEDQLISIIVAATLNALERGEPNSMLTSGLV